LAITPFPIPTSVNWKKDNIVRHVSRLAILSGVEVREAVEGFVGGGVLSHGEGNSATLTSEIM